MRLGSTSAEIHRFRSFDNPFPPFLSALRGVLATHLPLLDNHFCAWLCVKAGSAARRLACRKDRAKPVLH
jgi:hypothetical protein